MSTQMQESDDRWIFRGTNRQKGRHVAVTPQNSQMKHLVYGRIILDAGEPRAAFSTGELETGLICLSGECTIKAAGETHRIDRKSTRLNSSHRCISYDVFCLKKKNRRLAAWSHG